MYDAMEKRVTMSNIKQHTIWILAVIFLGLAACQQPGPNQTGSEYMPDMAHSIAYEANYYTPYFLNNWDEGSVKKYKELAMHHNPVPRTIPRGYAGLALAANEHMAAEEKEVLQGAQGGVAVPANGHVPFYYGDSEEERQRAIEEIRSNPYYITEEGLAKGKDLYVIYCGICHGDKGDGDGYLVRDANPATGDPGGKYPAAPVNFMLDDFVNSSNGRYYYAIMYGKNVMGSYADKLSYEERWQVIHYIRSLQAKAKGLEYSPQANTLNPEYGIPVADAAHQMPDVQKEEMEADDATTEAHNMEQQHH